MEEVCDISEQQTLYIVTKSTIAAKTENWDKNRPEDPIRVKAIRSYHDKFKIEFLDGIVYSWLSNGKYVIYDGWTRYSASNGDMRMLMCVYETEFEQDIVHHFLALNSAVPVPSLYIKSDNDDAVKRDAILAVVNDMCKRYKGFLSASTRPQRPNFNRDTLTEQLIQLPLEGLDSELILQKLQDANEAIKRKGKNFGTKATNGNLYLFANKKIMWQHELLEQLRKKDKVQTWFTELIG